MSVPSPGDVPIDICTLLPNGNLFCVKSTDIVQSGTRPCSTAPGGTTPPLFSGSISYTEKEISLTGDTKVVTSNSVWAGIEHDRSAIWVGEETSKECAKLNIDIPTPVPSPSSIGELYDEARSIAKRMADKFRDFTGEPENDVAYETLIAALTVFVLALILAPPTGLPG